MHYRCNISEYGQYTNVNASDTNIALCAVVLSFKSMKQQIFQRQNQIKPNDGGPAIHHPTAGGGGRGAKGGGAEGAGQVPPHLQHLQGDEEGGAPLGQGGQRGQGVRAGVCQRVHLIHHQVGLSTYQLHSAMINFDWLSFTVRQVKGVKQKREKPSTVREKLYEMDSLYQHTICFR